MGCGGWVLVKAADYFKVIAKNIIAFFYANCLEGVICCYLYGLDKT